MNTMSTGEIIKDMLNRTGKTQADLARFLGISPITVNRWIPTEKKRGIIPNEKNMKKIAEFFKVPIEFIAGQTGAYESSRYEYYIKRQQKKWQEFIKFLESMGYKIETQSADHNEDTYYLYKKYKIKWIEGGEIESRELKGLDLELFLNKLEKHIKIEIENYY